MKEVYNLAEIVELSYKTGYDRANEKNIQMLKDEIIKEEHKRLSIEIEKLETKEEILELIK